MALLGINEAFAAVCIQSAADLGIDDERVNVNGGAIALGHPLGMSGARVVHTLALDLARRAAALERRPCAAEAVKATR